MSNKQARIGGNSGDKLVPDWGVDTTPPPVWLVDDIIDGDVS